MLSNSVRFWPPQHHADNICSKWKLVQNLDMIAATRTFSARPKTRLLHDGEMLSDKMVMKRTHSDAGEHVLIPHDKNTQEKRNWEYLRSQLNIPRSQWMGQTYVELLAKRGEWRVFVIGGQIVYTVHTIRNPEKRTWAWDVVRTYYSLDELT